MRELLTSLFLSSCLLPIAAGGMQISSALSEPIVPHSFADLHAEPLWSSEVRRVDPSQQAYERLPGVVVANPVVSGGKPVRSVKALIGESPKTANASSEIGGPSGVGLAEVQAAEAQEWCSARYRSYNPEDNTYQAYGGGPRRVCSAPVGTPSSPVHEVADVSNKIKLDVRARWCSERYNSYRVEDNTYQPFTGSRKKCTGPAASNMSAATVAKF